LLAYRDSATDPQWEEAVWLDLCDVAVLGADLDVRLARTPVAIRQAHENALRIVQELEDRHVRSAELSRARKYHSEALGLVVDESAASSPRSAWDHYVVGRSLRIAGQYREASLHLERAIDLNPRVAVFFFEAGNCAAKQQRYADARSLFTTCIAVTASHPGRAGTAAASTGTLDVCYCNRGLAEFELQQWSRAEADLTQALTLNPQLPAAWLYRGRIRRDRREYASALADFQQALDLGFSPAQVHYQIALTYRDAGQWPKVRQHAHLARQFPGFPPEIDGLAAEVQKHDIEP
jgi:tetratricopeptide (TPR) repeat protein